MPAWLRAWLIIAAIVGGGALLIFGVVFFAALAALILVPFAIWAWATGKLKPAGPATIEGTATVVEERPLTENDKRLLAATPVWVVWYEDQFHVGAERDSFGVGVCFSEEDARTFVARSGGKMLVPGYDGHDILGPENPLTTPLFGAQRSEIIGAILDRLERDSREPVPMRF